jgi:hypothetical protein
VTPRLGFSVVMGLAVLGVGFGLYSRPRTSPFVGGLNSVQLEHQGLTGVSQPRTSASRRQYAGLRDSRTMARRGIAGQLVLPTDQIQRFAEMALAGEPDRVRDLVNAVVDLSAFSTIPGSVRNRLLRAELAFRDGSAPPIRHQEIANASNELADELGAPSFARTSEAQIRVFRERMRDLVPSLSALGSDNLASMSPVEAAFILSTLAFQKLANPAFQIDPNAWAAEVTARVNRGASSTSSPAPQLDSAPFALGPVYRSIVEDLRDESGVSVGIVHRFLDNIGLKR